jgi:hypothetical protein
VGAALLYYFGWSRSQAQARSFGTDVSVFEMSSNELALRSLDAVFFPGLLLLLAALVGLRLHRVLLGQSPVRSAPEWSRWLGRVRWPEALRVDRPTWTRRVILGLERSWLVLLPIAATLLAVTDDFGYLTLPFWIGLAMFGRVYGAALRRQTTGDSTRISLPVMGVVTALFIVVLFWQTERLAVLFGSAAAQDIKNDPSRRLHLATLYSSKRLYLTAPGVTETALSGPENSYRYRYDGLYLLQRSGGKYFLLSDGWNDNHGKLLVVLDNESVRLDFSG